MHATIGGGVSTDFKSSNRIKICWLVQILLHFYWFGAPTPQGGGGRVEWVSGGLEMMWGPSRWCGDDGDDTGMMWRWRGWCGDHTDNMGWRPRRQRRPQRPQTMGTIWGPSGAMGMMWGQWGWHRDNVGMTGMMGGQHGDHGGQRNH